MAAVTEPAHLPPGYGGAYAPQSPEVEAALEWEREILARISRGEYDAEEYDALMLLYFEAVAETNEAHLAGVRRLTGLTRQRAVVIVADRAERRRLLERYGASWRRRVARAERELDLAAAE